MQYRSLATVISSGVIGLASLASPPSLSAQMRFAAQSSPVGLPPTELLGVQAEFARPHVVPLEESFADAQSVKRSMAYRARSVALESR